MKILITGRGGQVAQSLLERAGSLPELHLEAVGRPELDLETKGSAERVVAAARPNVVLNAAAYTAVDAAEHEPERAMRINAEGAGDLAAAAKAAGARIIQISTDYVFDGRSGEPYSEDAPTNPLNAYGRSKLEAEQLVRSANPEHVIVRSAWIYSAFGRNFVKMMWSAVERRDALTVIDDQRGSPTSASDLAAGLIAILERWSAGDGRGLGQTYHLAGSEVTSWCGLARQVMSERERLGLKTAQVRPIGTDEWLSAAERPRNSSLDCRKFERDFGYRAPDWRASLRGVVERLVRQG